MLTIDVIRCSYSKSYKNISYANKDMRPAPIMYFSHMMRRWQLGEGDCGWAQRWKTTTRAYSNQMGQPKKGLVVLQILHVRKGYAEPKPVQANHLEVPITLAIILKYEGTRTEKEMGIKILSFSK